MSKLLSGRYYWCDSSQLILFSHTKHSEEKKKWDLLTWWDKEVKIYYIEGIRSCVFDYFKYMNRYFPTTLSIWTDISHWSLSLLLVRVWKKCFWHVIWQPKSLKIAITGQEIPIPLGLNPPQITLLRNNISENMYVFKRREARKQNICIQLVLT